MLYSVSSINYSFSTMQSKLYFRWTAFLLALHPLTRQAKDCSERRSGKASLTQSCVFLNLKLLKKRLMEHAGADKLSATLLNLTLAKSMLLKIG